jgi:hypothetical protein
MNKEIYKDEGMAAVHPLRVDRGKRVKQPTANLITVDFVEPKLNSCGIKISVY